MDRAASDRGARRCPQLPGTLPPSPRGVRTIRPAGAKRPRRGLGDAQPGPLDQPSSARFSHSAAKFRISSGTRSLVISEKVKAQN